MYLGQVEISTTWAKLEDLIKAQIYGQSAFAFNAAKKYQIQCKSPNNLFVDEFVRLPSLSVATASIGTSTGISAASVVKTTFESIVFESGVYDFIYDSGIGSLESDESGESIEPSWTFNGVDVTLSDYGISVTGTPNDGDIVTIDFIASNTGEIGIEVAERELIEYVVDTVSSSILCVRAKNRKVLVNIDELEA